VGDVEDKDEEPATPGVEENSLSTVEGGIGGAPGESPFAPPPPTPVGKVVVLPIVVLPIVPGMVVPRAPGVVAPGVVAVEGAVAEGDATARDAAVPLDPRMAPMLAAEWDPAERDVIPELP
jgi:hypothetical protein